MFHTVDYLPRAKSIAIIEASDSSRGRRAQDIYENLQYTGFPAKLYPVVWGALSLAAGARIRNRRRDQLFHTAVHSLRKCGS